MQEKSIYEINNLEDAQNAWDLFFNRFYSPEIPQGVEVSFDKDLREFNPRKNPNAKNQHYSKTQERTSHSDDFDDFLNGNTISIPKNVQLTQEDLDTYEEAINEGNYNHEILKQKDHIFYALWLFRQNKISRLQMSTLLAIDQIPKKYPLKVISQVLNEEGQFNEIAEQILIPLIENTCYNGRFTLQEKERFLLLIQSLPKSEQIIYFSTPNPNIISSYSFQLGNALTDNRIWHPLDKSGKDVHLSFGIIEALKIARLGVNGACANRAKLGEFTLDTIKEGVENNYRPTAIAIRHSKVKKSKYQIHDWPYTPMPVVTAHDVYHAQLQNSLPAEFNMMLTHIKQIIAKHTKYKWSKTMWEVIDRELLHFTSRTPKTVDNAEKGAALFSKMMNGFYENADKILLVINDQLTDEGIVVFWDMVRESDKWQNLYKIKVDRLTGHYEKPIQSMKSFFHTLDKKDSPSEIINLKYRLFTTMKSKQDFHQISHLIDEIQDTLVKENKDESELIFQNKITPEEQPFRVEYKNKTVKNTIGLKFKDQESPITENNALDCIPKLVSLYNTTKVTGLDKETFNNSLLKISKHFKSSYDNSDFSKERLEKAMNQLPSNIYVHLQFLEACYEKLMTKGQYHRKNPLADKLFYFFKNQLTTSAREHVQILKEKREEIIQDYLNILVNDSDKELFKWITQNSNSKLAQCRTERFYLHLTATH